MKRSKGITVLSLCFIMMNLVTLDAVAGFRLAEKAPAFLAFSFLFRNNAVLMLKDPWSAIAAVMLLALGGYLFSLREIARRIFIFVQGLSMIAGLCIAPVEIARWSGGGNVAQHIPALVAYAVIFNVWPVVFMIFFTRPKVKAQFH